MPIDVDQPAADRLSWLRAYLRRDMTERERHLQVLGQPSDASPAAVKEAWRDLAKVWHPDRFSGDEKLRKKAEAQLQLINAAYSYLRAHPRQQRPDERHGAGASAPNRRPTSERSPAATPTSRRRAEQRAPNPAVGSKEREQHAARIRQAVISLATKATHAEGSPTTRIPHLSWALGLLLASVALIVLMKLVGFGDYSGPGMYVWLACFAGPALYLYVMLQIAHGNAGRLVVELAQHEVVCSSCHMGIVSGSSDGPSSQLKNIQQRATFVSSHGRCVDCGAEWW